MKYLKFILDDYFLVFYLCMEGKYFMDVFLNKYIYVVFNLLSGYILSYEDICKFGCFEFVDIKYKDIYLKDIKGFVKDFDILDLNIFYSSFN